MGVWLLISAAWATCPDPAAGVATAERAVVEARFDDAEAALAQAEAGFVCGDPADPDVLARMWMAEGAWLVLQDRNDEAKESFAAAKRVSPDLWNADYGDRIRAVYDESRDSGEMGQLSLRPAPDAYAAYLDGDEAVFPRSAEAGLHLIQVGPRTKAAQFGKVVALMPGDTLVVTTDLVEVAPAPTPVAVTQPVPTDEPTTTTRSPALLIVSGAALALAAGSAGLALAQNGAMKNATTTEELDAAFARQKAFGATSYGLLGVGAVGGTLHFVLR
jgi:hypothetical protein